MIKHLITLFSLLLCTVNPGLGQAEAPRHVILITLDGFRPDFYLDPSWGAVNLRQLMAEGVHAKGVNSVFPSVTYPSHTTIVTGAKPATHGIYYNSPFEPSEKSGRWYWEFDLIQSPTLWEAAGQAGLTTASVFWPVTVGAPVDYNIPIIRPTEKGVGRVELTSRHATPEGLLEELEKYATGELEAGDVQQDDNAARMAAYLIKKYRPHFLTVHLVDLDHAEHAAGRDGAEVRRAVAVADHNVGVIVDAVKQAGLRESTVVIVTGDHGFAGKHTTLSPNVWLAEAGLYGSQKEGKWKARFHTSGGSAFLHLHRKDDEETLEAVKKMLSNLPAAQRALFRIVSPTELKNIGADPNASLALTALPGISFSGADKGEPVRGTSGGVHGHFPDFPQLQTGFIASGPGLRNGAVIPVMGLADVAPLVARLLQLDFNAPDGILYPGILQNP